MALKHVINILLDSPRQRLSHARLSRFLVWSQIRFRYRFLLQSVPLHKLTQPTQIPDKRCRAICHCIGWNISEVIWINLCRDYHHGGVLARLKKMFWHFCHDQLLHTQVELLSTTKHKSYVNWPTAPHSNVMLSRSICELSNRGSKSVFCVFHTFRGFQANMVILSRSAGDFIHDLLHFVTDAKNMLAMIIRCECCHLWILLVDT